MLSALSATHFSSLLPHRLGHSDSVSAVGFSHDGTLVATGGLDGCVRVWNVATGAVVVVLDASAEVEVNQFTKLALSFIFFCTQADVLYLLLFLSIVFFCC